LVSVSLACGRDSSAGGSSMIRSRSLDPNRRRSRRFPPSRQRSWGEPNHPGRWNVVSPL